SQERSSLVESSTGCSGGSFQVSLKPSAPSLHTGAVGESFPIAHMNPGCGGISSDMTMVWGVSSLNRGGSMITKLRVESSGMRRRKGLLRALVVMGVAYVLTYLWSTTAVSVIRAIGPGVSDITVVVVSAGIVGIGTLTAVVLLVRRPRPLVDVAGAHRFAHRSARKLVRRIRRNWLQICRQSRVTIEQRVKPSKVMVHAPRVAGIRPSALGIDI